MANGLMWRRTKELLPVQLALKLGWTPHEDNGGAFQHFYFSGPAKFEVHWHNGAAAYVVDGIRETYVPDVLKRLELAAMKTLGPVQ